MLNSITKCATKSGKFAKLLKAKQGFGAAISIGKKKYIPPKTNIIEISNSTIGDLDNKLFMGAKRHPMFNKNGTISEDGLCLVRLDNELPQNGILRTSREIYQGEYGSKGVRNSLHFAVNHPVQKVNGGFATWDYMKQAYIMPFSGVKNIAGGCPVDMFTKGSVKIPPGTIIVKQNPSIPSGKYRISDVSRINQFENLKGVKLVETSETPHAACPQIIKKLGYKLKQGGNFSWNDNIDKHFIDFLDKKNLFSAIHAYTPNAKIESLFKFIGERAHFKQGWQAGEKNLQDELVKAIDKIKLMAKEYNYPLDFDVNKIQQIIKTSESPQTAITKMRKQLHLSDIPNFGLFSLSDSQSYKFLAEFIGAQNPVVDEYNRIIVNFINGKGGKNYSDLQNSLKHLDTNI